MAAVLTTTNQGLLASNTLSGDGAAITNLTRGNISLGTPSAVLVNDVTGAISDISLLDPARGGTGQNTSASTGVMKTASGVWSASTIVNTDIDATAAIARTKLASGTADAVLINDASGVMSSETQLSVARGGTGTNSALATGLAKVNTGVWSYSALVDADVSASAAIARSKLANGMPAHVVINGPGGAFSSEAQLMVSRGGTGQDFSASGPGPFALQLSTGVFSAVTATPTATITSYVTRDGSGNTAVNALTASNITSTGNLTVNPSGNLSLTPTGNVLFAAAPLISVPTGIAGGRASQFIVNLSTAGAAFVPAWSYTTSVNTSYLVVVWITGIDVAGGTGTITVTFQYRAKNIAGVVSKAGDQNTQLSREAPINAANARGAVNATSLLAEVSASAGRTVRWCVVANVVEQAL